MSVLIPMLGACLCAVVASYLLGRMHGRGALVRKMF